VSFRRAVFARGICFFLSRRTPRFYSPITINATEQNLNSRRLQKFQKFPLTKSNSYGNISCGYRSSTTRSCGSALFSLPPQLSTRFLSSTSTLFKITDRPQLPSTQPLPNSLPKIPGVYPPVGVRKLASAFPTCTHVGSERYRGQLPARCSLSALPCSFLHFFALPKIPSPFVSAASALLAEKHRGVGHALAPAFHRDAVGPLLHELRASALGSLLLGFFGYQLSAVDCQLAPHSCRGATMGVERATRGGRAAPRGAARQVRRQTSADRWGGKRTASAPGTATAPARPPGPRRRLEPLPQHQPQNVLRLRAQRQPNAAFVRAHEFTKTFAERGKPRAC
jgi:hypothetical protein